MTVEKPHESHRFAHGICIYCDRCTDSTHCSETVEPCDNKIGRIVAEVIGLAFREKEPTDEQRRVLDWTDGGQDPVPDT